MILLVVDKRDFTQHSAGIISERLEREGFKNLILLSMHPVRPLEIFSLSNLPEVDVKYIEELVAKSKEI